MGNLLGVNGFDYETSEAVRDEVVNKQTDVSAQLSNHLNVPVVQSAAALAHAGFERIANVPIHSADALARRSSVLQQTADAKPPRAWLSPEYLAEHNLTDGDIVKVSQGDKSVLLPVARDKGLPSGVIRVAAGHPATAALDAMFATLTVERA